MKKVAAGTWTAEEVTIAFLKRATIGQQLLNFATEFMAESAINRAKELDAAFRNTGEISGPLHGVPISVKELIAFKGRVCNADDAFIVQLLQNAGAVMYVRTNQPQTLMHIDTSNNITGITLNPNNLNLTPGGSSGGEGAALAFKCSALGVGTDVAGSIRVPAAFNGVYGLRTTGGRLSGYGIRAAVLGQESVRGVLGPLAQSRDDIDLFMKSLLDQTPWEVDCSLAPVPWRSVKATASAITVAILADDGIVAPHPPITRALGVAKQMLVAAGVKVVDWKPFEMEKVEQMTGKLLFADGAKSTRDVLDESNEPLRPLTELLLNQFSNPISVYENWGLNYEREVLKGTYHHIMQQAGIDVFLGPTYPVASDLNGTPTYVNYTAMWNLLDMPAVVFPSGLKVDGKLDLADPMYKARNDRDAEMHAKYLPKAIRTC
ncbi:fatty-acid amide hydrolase [Calycina marina]|uniref:amidase n=1 Tax=Calycina marina TaxID=1763456 RepID=A0A9P7YTS7_9HELO|nr:fatty-acid amide hydrolase [Calycina marina]